MRSYCRSVSDMPPHMPYDSLTSAYSRHGVLTGHVSQMVFAFMMSARIFDDMWACSASG